MTREATCAGSAAGPGRTAAPIGPDRDRGIRLRTRRRIALLRRPAVRLRDSWMFADPARGRLAVRDAAVDREPPFFVLGSPRSGTTLLRRTLAGHSELFLPPENGAIQRMIRVFGAARGGRWEDAATAVLDAFAEGYEHAHWKLASKALLAEARSLPPARRSLAALFDLVYRRWGEANAPGKGRWGDKSTPGSFAYLYKLDHVFPTARYVHIVRDGRDCVVSCCRAGFFDGSPSQAALAWLDNVRLCRRFGRRTAAGRYHQLRYEDFVARPERELRELCAFLGIEFEREMLATPAAANAHAADVRAIAHHGNVMNAISTGSVGGWREALSPAAAARISRYMGSELQRFGYAR